MKQATSQDPSEHPLGHLVAQRLREGALLLNIAVAVFFLVSLATYSNLDPGWSSTGFSDVVVNAGGRIGAYFADLSLYLFGYCAYFLPLLYGYAMIALFREKTSPSAHYHMVLLRTLGFVLIIFASTGLASLLLPNIKAYLPLSAGGILGELIAIASANQFNRPGSLLLLLTLLLGGLTWFAGISWITLIKRGSVSLFHYPAVRRVLDFSLRDWIMRRWYARKEQVKPVITMPEKKVVSLKLKKDKPRVDVRIEPVFNEPVFNAPIDAPLKPEMIKPPKAKPIKFPTLNSAQLPSLDILSLPAKTNQPGLSKLQLEQKSREVEQRLHDFGVIANVVAVHPGPVITRYELDLAPGVKASRLTNIARDLARSLSMVSVRVVEIIPGKSVVGLELPNETRHVVTLREVLQSQQYDQAASPLSLGLGKDIAGHPVVVDLGKMPHLLVAGTTGSGKSVGVNAMLLSMLYKALPSQVRFILVDPKMLELSVYEGIPHLLAPVVTDMNQAANALRWCVGEMERRYKVMSALGVRNLAGFNQKVSDAIKANKPIPDPLASPVQGEPVYLETLPFVVVIVDEFADMMMVVGKKVEQLIARLAQKARAAGIHLILATQRPSVDVITGLIKANIPTRISFQVSSKIDSRTVLDQQGAEQLLGHGDMLYATPGSGVPMRVHGAFVSDDEVHAVVSALKTLGAPDYLPEILDFSQDDDTRDGAGQNGNFEDAEQDHLYDEAVKFITSTRRASISSVQRRFKIGYNRAARLIEQMEQSGVVTRMETNGSREVLAPPPVED